MKIVIIIMGCAAMLAACKDSAAPDMRMPTDNNATPETVELYNRLFDLKEKGVMVAHQDDLAYGHQRYEPGHSDIMEISGDYPAVVGWDIGHIESGAAYNLDSVYFSDMKRLIAETHTRGGITTISWHGDNIVTGGSTWDCELDKVVRSVLPENSHHAAYLAWLNRIADFFLDLKDSNEKLIPIVFRMYHEHTSSWFWWGARQSTPEEYKQLWHMTVRHLRETRGVHNLLYAYSPSECTDEATYLERYPGDEWVDIVGFDVYLYGEGEEASTRYIDNMERNIAIVTKYAAKAGKIAAVSETGMEGVSDHTYFTDIIYPLVSGKDLSWILFWRNAWEPDKPGHFYMPYAGHPSAADFTEFASMPGILMNRNIQERTN